MKPLTVLSAAGQVAEHLRGELLGGGLRGNMPGVETLAEELGVNHKTVRAALRQLEAEGLLVSEGQGRHRRIVTPMGAGSPSMRVAILDYDPPGNSDPLLIAVLHQLCDRGHNAFLTNKTLIDMRLDVGRVSRFVRQTEADAWIVGAAPRGILRWFVEEEIPTLSLFGDCGDLPVAAAGLDYLPTLLELVGKLVGHGHRRIVFLQGRGCQGQREHRLWRAVFSELERNGIRTGDYNLPHWNDSRDGFRSLLDSLFAHTPPTALVIEEIPHLIATLQYCGQRGIRVPQDLSIASLSASPDFDYCHPALAHVRWDSRRLLKRINRWVDHVAGGKEDRRQIYEATQFVEGGTMGPPGAGKA